MVFPSQKRIYHGWSSEELLVSWHPWSHQITLPSGCCGSNSGNFCKASSETCSWGWDKGMTDPLSPPAVQPPAQPATQVCQASAQVWPLPKWFWTLLRLKMSPLGMVLCWSHLHYTGTRANPSIPYNSASTVAPVCNRCSGLNRAV